VVSYAISNSASFATRGGIEPFGRMIYADMPKADAQEGAE
jgi:hypothetical protein